MSLPSEPAACCHLEADALEQSRDVGPGCGVRVPIDMAPPSLFEEEARPELGECRG